MAVKKASNTQKSIYLEIFMYRLVHGLNWLDLAQVACLRFESEGKNGFCERLEKEEGMEEKGKGS